MLTWQHNGKLSYVQLPASPALVGKREGSDVLIKVSYINFPFTFLICIVVNTILKLGLLI